ncbi:hypothetical protein [Burkholderia sp. Leaf177]|uniref:hypothetical protein n=1 Tax=Burkholderia sp. Leaf177 TaxID=1736287 RepID=UPI000A688214|nr:hypothetical protein [Burkholderia sp. Leaf177]
MRNYNNQFSKESVPRVMARSSLVPPSAPEHFIRSFSGSQREDQIHASPTFKQIVIEAT